MSPGANTNREQPAEPEAGCTVDWSWLRGREIVAATSDLQQLVITFADGETLSVQASLYQGRPFLAFMPWKAM